MDTSTVLTDFTLICEREESNHTFHCSIYSQDVVDVIRWALRALTISVKRIFRSISPRYLCVLRWIWWSTLGYRAPIRENAPRSRYLYHHSEIMRFCDQDVETSIPNNINSHALIDPVLWNREAVSSTSWDISHTQAITILYAPVSGLIFTTFYLQMMSTPPPQSPSDDPIIATPWCLPPCPSSYLPA